MDREVVDEHGALGAFTRLQAEEWEFRLREDPIFATMAGDRRYNDRLPAATVADFEHRKATLQEFRSRLGAIEQGALSHADHLNYDIFARVLDDAIAEIEFRSYLLPIAKVGGFHSSFAELADYTPFDTVDDYERYLERLRAFPRYVDEHIELMRQGVSDGYLPPRITLDGIDDALRTQIVADPSASPLYRPFTEYPAAVPTADHERLTEAGRQAVTEAVVPGYRSLLDFVVSEYLSAARDDVAAAGLPNGTAFYEYRVRSHTTLDITPQAVHDLGRAEVERIRAEMEQLIRATGFAGSFAEFVTFLRTDPRFYCQTPDALMKEVALVLKRIDGELPRLFRTLPRTPYGIRPVPDYLAPKTTTAYYFPPAGDGSRAGVYYVNTYDLPSRPTYEIEALSLHEAVPGHHLQIALQLELTDLPHFRRWALFTAFVEGWALYAERLGLEVGFYTDPYSNFGRLTYEMWRACRLVVDTGMHALGWSRQQAIDWMAEHSALTMLNIANEVDRYIAWPGQALAYKLGELKIRELRARAEQTLGSGFNLRGFHDRILEQGALPLDLLDSYIDDWLAEQSIGG